MILLSHLHKIIAKGNFSIAFVDQSGAVVAVPDAILTNWHSKGRTMNIKIIGSGVIRTIRRCTIINYNNEEVAL